MVLCVLILQRLLWTIFSHYFLHFILDSRRQHRDKMTLIVNLETF
uniref:Uncharacterized protein n=1 Tax=Arundo donax TaxID=35708 RepID=A0A0A9GBQ6_ARUDO